MFFFVNPLLQTLLLSKFFLKLSTWLLLNSLEEIRPLDGRSFMPASQLLFI